MKSDLYNIVFLDGRYCAINNGKIVKVAKKKAQAFTLGNASKVLDELNDLGELAYTVKASDTP